MTVKQLSLFPEVDTRPVHRRPRPAIRVAQDPGVQESFVRRSALGCDLHSAFVSFWAGLTPERRAELRSKIAA